MTSPTSSRSSDDLRAVVLAGGLSHEREVSVRSGRRVADALRAGGIDVVVHDVDADLVPTLHDVAPDVVWPLLHGATGEDGSVREILDLLDLPYVGTGPGSSRVAWNKEIAKGVVSAAGIATPDSVTLQQDLFRELGAGAVMDALVARIGLPLVVKPSRGGSALGVSVVDSRGDLARALVASYAYGEAALVERAIAGTEVAVSIVETDDGPLALPAVEIVTDGPYDYDARYNPGRSQYFTPARLDPATSERVSSAAVTAFRELGLRHLGRVDLIVDEDGVPHFLETNVAPGMTETSLFPQAVLASGTTLAATYRDIVERAARPR
ncbi:D-alanine--D-alanine ligase family protein [Luteimicrobium sp. DT211]|uniref:D-alanine--D-alanine ligase family protein n=1 Tax=Luteimicrobium sp. DT211 TaxID=3393412 RepID=UPI003CF9759B